MPAKPANAFQYQEYKLNGGLNDDLGIDSLSAVELSLELESNFGIRIEDEELANLKTVKDMVELIESKK